MTREDLKIHWKVIEAFKNGAEIQFRYENSDWNDISDVSFSGKGYWRIKPKWIPENGDKILVSKNGRYWFTRIFVEMREGNFICINGSEEKVVNIYTGSCTQTADWNLAKPLIEE